MGTKITPQHLVLAATELFTGKLDDVWRHIDREVDLLETTGKKMARLGVTAQASDIERLQALHQRLGDAINELSVITLDNEGAKRNAEALEGHRRCAD